MEFYKNSIEYKASLVRRKEKPSSISPRILILVFSASSHCQIDDWDNKEHDEIIDRSILYFTIHLDFRHLPYQTDDIGNQQRDYCIAKKSPNSTQHFSFPLSVVHVVFLDAIHMSKFDNRLIDKIRHSLF